MIVASHVARAMALAAVRLGASDAALAHLGGRDGAAARALVAGGAFDVAAVRAELAAPRPAGWREIHASWLGGSHETRDGEESVSRYRARIAFGELVPMRPGPLVSLEPGALVRALAILGRRQLAHALGGSASRSIAELAARLSWGRELLAEVASIRGLGIQADARLGGHAAARARIAGLTWTDPLAVVRAGARAIAAHVDGKPDLAAQLAQRLPRPVGTIVLDDLRTHAAAGGAGEPEIAAAVARVTVAHR